MLYVYVVKLLKLDVMVKQELLYPLNYNFDS
jgi:hypothetical protein